MAYLLMPDAADDFQFWPNFSVSKAVLGFCTIVVVLLLTTGFVFGADSPVIAPGAKLEILGEGVPYADGPAADRDGNVFFTDPFKNRIALLLPIAAKWRTVSP